MNRIKAIRDENDYKEALAMLEVLIDMNPAPDSAESEQLDILSTLIESYEAKSFPQELPSAIDAIKFKMEQDGLQQRDLEQYIGTKGRVSEILSGKRSLSIEMIRALEVGLGIPAKVLVQKSAKLDDEYDNWDRAVVTQMKKRGYFEGLELSISNAGELLERFFGDTNTVSHPQMLLKQSSYRAVKANKQALAAWTNFVVKSSHDIASFAEPVNVDLEFMRTIARLSSDPEGPLLAQAKLAEAGILLVLEPALVGTRLDGATIFNRSKNPIIGLTLRYDRLDNFWFTLMHELAHISLHSDHDDIDLFFDDLFTKSGEPIDKFEKEADDLAGEALVSSAAWETSPARLVPSPITAKLLAKQLGVHIAVVAGKIRHESKQWTILNDLVEKNNVRYLFPSKTWDKS
jgi:HTH-type transcriptional regulator/antitoxin HigA